MLRSHLKRLRRLLPSALERPLRAAYLIFMHRVRHDWSSDGETTMVRTLTRDFPERSFVEVGANDGISFSTTYGLLVDGWTGLCIEPHPATFETLRRTLARFPRATPVRYAAAATPDA